LEITVNVKQMIAFIWTMVAVAVSIIIVFAPVGPLYIGLGSWQMSLLLFFVSLLVLTLPVYLLLALWHVLSEKPETE